LRAVRASCSQDSTFGLFALLAHKTAPVGLFALLAHKTAPVGLFALTGFGALSTYMQGAVKLYSLQRLKTAQAF
jgi:hypothetical protein